MASVIIAKPLPVAGNRFTNWFRRYRIENKLIDQYDTLTFEEASELGREYVAAGGDADEFRELRAMLSMVDD